MIRENRYTVFKNKDIVKYLTEEQKQFLDTISETIVYGRVKDKRHEFNCAIVESDWPEYETVWKLIEDRVDKENKMSDFVTVEMSILEYYIVNGYKNRFWDNPKELEKSVRMLPRHDKMNLNCLDKFLEESLNQVRWDFVLQEIRLQQIQTLKELNKEQCPKN